MVAEAGFRRARRRAEMTVAICILCGFGHLANHTSFLGGKERSGPMKLCTTFYTGGISLIKISPRRRVRTSGKCTAGRTLSKQKMNRRKTWAALMKFQSQNKPLRGSHEQIGAPQMLNPPRAFFFFLTNYFLFSWPRKWWGPQNFSARRKKTLGSSCWPTRQKHEVLFFSGLYFFFFI